MVKKRITFANQVFLMEVDEQELENKVLEIETGETPTKEEGAIVTDYTIFRAQLAPNVSNYGYDYIPCEDNELLALFGTISGDNIVEFFYKHDSALKTQI